MFRLIIEPEEMFDERNKVFVPAGEVVVINLEHSLVSLSKWESKYQKPFLTAQKKTAEEIFEYFKVMIVDEDIDPELLHKCTQKNFEDIQRYIDSSQTATTFSMMPKGKPSTEIITSELIYYWMVAFTIPWEAQYWHLSRLLTLIQVCDRKNSKPKPMSKAEMARQRAELNAKRRAELGTRG